MDGDPKFPAKLDKKLVLKYFFDKIYAVLIIIFLSPIILLIIIAMYVEGIFDPEAKGPFFYKEKRISRGEVFILYKFRVLKTHIAENVSADDSATFLQAEKENTTRIGRILIKIYFDELPQFVNVLKGEMSIVGPRPRIPSIYERDLDEGYRALKYLRGGITGLDQLFKSTRMVKSPEANESYLEVCSSYNPVKILFFDLIVILKTPWVVFMAKGY